MGLIPYLDMSILMPLFAADALAYRADAWRRMGLLTRPDADSALGRFDEWSAAVARPAALAPTDLDLARSWIAQFDMPRRAPAALHLALAHRLGVTFDACRATAVHAPGLPVAAA